MDPVIVQLAVDPDTAGKIADAAEALGDITFTDFTGQADLLAQIAAQLQQAASDPIVKHFDDDGQPVTVRVSFESMLSEDLADDVRGYEALAALLTGGVYVAEDERYTVADRALLIAQAREHIAGPNRGDESAEMAQFPVSLLDAGD